MAAFGTVKPGFEMAAELQFPQQFSREYARRQLGERYAPSDSAPVVQDYVGDDFFADYHAQKRADAQRTVMNGVADTRRSVNRAMVSHAGYYGMPAPVRSQRRIGADVGVHIGANALYGAGISNAAPVAGMGLEGGVIGSREGRVWVKNALVKRTAELDAIDAAQAEGPTIQAAVEKGLEPGQLEETEAAVVWQRILQQARAGEFGTETMALVPKAVTTLTDMFSKPENLEKLNDYQYEIDDAATAVRAQLVSEATEDNARRTLPYRRRVGDPGVARGEDIEPVSERLVEARTWETITNNHVIVLDLFTAALKYLDLIGKSVQEVGVPSDKQMKAISRAAAKESKLGQVIKIRAIQTIGPPGSQKTRQGTTESSSSSSSSSGPDSRVQSTVGSELSGWRSGISASSTFTPDGTSYEYSSGPSTVYSREDLTDFNRDIFGRQGRPGEFRGERSFYGEDDDESNWRPGLDIVEEVPRGFTNVVRNLATDVDYKEAEGEDAEAEKLARVREAAQELGITSLADIEEEADAMPPGEASRALNRVAVHLASAYAGKPTTASRHLPTVKSQINQLLTAAFR